MFNRDRFHNQLALNLGHKLINDKRYTLNVEDSDDPWVMLKVQGQEVIKIKASDNCNDELQVSQEIQNEIQFIVEAVHQAYFSASKCRF